MRKHSVAFLLLLVLLAAILIIGSGKNESGITGNIFLRENEAQNYNNSTELKLPWQKSVYIVEFKDSSIAEGMQIQGEGYADYINSQHQQAKIDIGRIFYGASFAIQSEGSESGLENIIVADYKYVFNGMALNISQRDLFFIERLSYVKRIFPDKMYHIELNESVPLIQADSAWNLTDGNGDNITGKNITIAILDTGIDYTHPDLGGCTNDTFLAGTCSKVIGGHDYINNDNNPMDDHGHGTHVSATAAGNGTEALKGVAPDARIIAFKVCNSGGGCPGYYIVGAIENASASGYNIISMSIGGWSNDPDDALALAADNAVKAGAVVVIAAGNEGQYGSGTIGSPGTSRKAITVGASWKNDALASFSGRGPTKIGTIKPDVLAPGVLICAAQWDSAWNSSKCYDSQHVKISGTSMATPHVAGLAALILQKHRDWKPIDVKMAIRNTAEDLGYNLTEQGHGRINALAAVNLTAKPCTAEFYTYNTSLAVGGFYQFNGTALCDNFINYSVYVSAPLVFSPQNITSFLVSGDETAVNETNLSFSGNEAKSISIELPQIAVISFAQMALDGFDNSNTYPYAPLLDVGNDGSIDWRGFSSSVKQSLINGSEVAAGNVAVGQTFSWPGGEITGFSFSIVKSYWLQGLTLEVRNGTGSSPDQIMYNRTIANNDIPASGAWTFLNAAPFNLTNGTYWLILKVENPSSPPAAYEIASYTQDVYPEGAMQRSYDYGNSWTNTVWDLSFRIIGSNYFNESDVFGDNVFASAINSFLSRCSPDINGRCSVPIAINSTNGTVRISEFLVSYGGAYSQAGGWSPINYSAQQANESLLLNLGSAEIEDGIYIFELLVKGQNSSSSDYLMKKIDSYDIRSPEPGALVKNGTEIIGESNSPNLSFKNYTLEYLPLNGGSWTAFKFAENSSVNNGSLGYFNSTSLASGEYAIRSTIYLTNKLLPVIDNVTIKVDKMLRDGWPQETDFSLDSGPKIADLDGDGKDEIVVVTSRTMPSELDEVYYMNRSIYAFRENGSIMPGWPKPIYPPEFAAMVPALADIDSDGKIEVIEPSFNLTQMDVWRYDGTEQPGWPVAIYDVYNEFITGAPVVYDINNDKKPEIIFCTIGTWNGTLNVYSANGSLLWRLHDMRLAWNPSVGDVNGDGYGEIFFNHYVSTNSIPNQSDQLYLINSTGSIMPGWPLNFTYMENMVYAMSMADLNKDNKMEMLYVIGEWVKPNFFAVDANANNLSGWPASYHDWYMEIAPADLDMDKNLEIIFNPFTYYGSLAVLNANGSSFKDYPHMLPAIIGPTIYTNPLVFDINNDGKEEIMLSAAGPRSINGQPQWHYAYFYAMDYENFSVIQGFPLEGGGSGGGVNIGSRAAPAAVADLDRDGKEEIVMGTSYYTDRMPGANYGAGRLVVWNMNKTYNATMVGWGQAMNNIWNTNSYLDLDFDGVILNDNCPFKYNPAQADVDNDGVGDACDSIIGNETSINTTIPNITIEIGNSTNLTRQYNETFEIIFYANGTILLNFTANFSNYSFSLDLTAISIEAGVSNTNNYIIIRNLSTNGTKTVYAANSGSGNRVCFIDENPVSLENLLENCTVIDCPGTNGSYSCSVSGNSFALSGLRHSAVIDGYTPPSYDTGGTGGKKGGGTGGGILIPPAEQPSAQAAEEQAAATKTMVAAEKSAIITPQEQKPPAVEQPKEIEKPKSENYLSKIIIAAALAAILAVLIYLRARKKPQTGLAGLSAENAPAFNYEQENLKSTDNSELK